MPSISIQITASMVAWYAAIVSTLAVGVAVYNAWRDSARPQIKWEPNRMIFGDPDFPEDVTHLCVGVTNRGRRPIRIEQAALQVYGQSGHLLLAHSFSNNRIRVLDEQNPSTSILVRQDLFDIKKVYCVVVVDGTGRTYKKYLKRFPTFTRAFLWIRSKLSNTLLRLKQLVT